MFPENIRTDPTEGHWEFQWRGGERVVVVGISTAKHLKAKYEVTRGVGEMVKSQLLWEGMDFSEVA